MYVWACMCALGETTLVEQFYLEQNAFYHHFRHTHLIILLSIRKGTPTNLSNWLNAGSYLTDNEFEYWFDLK